MNILKFFILLSLGGVIGCTFEPRRGQNPSTLANLGTSELSLEDLAGESGLDNEVVHTSNVESSNKIILGSSPISVSATQTGTLQAAIPFDPLPAGNGFEPHLRLNYNLTDKAGIAGYGWDLDGLTILSRCAASKVLDGYEAPIQYNDQDRFCLNGKKLLLVRGENGRPGSEYRLFVDEQLRIKMLDDGSFEVKEKSGESHRLGIDISSRELGPSDAVLSWYLSKTTDRRGNSIDYRYIRELNKLYLSTVRYGGNELFGKNHYRQLTFRYEQLEAPTMQYVAGAGLGSTKLLKTVEAQSQEGAGWGYSLLHEKRGQAGTTVLIGVQQCFKGGSCFPANRLDYEFEDLKIEEEPSYSLKEFASFDNRDWYTLDTTRVFADLNGDGFEDILGIAKTRIIYTLGSPSGFKPLIVQNLATRIDWDPRSGMHSVNDLNADGYADIILFTSNDREKSGVYVALGSPEGFGEYQLWSKDFSYNWSVRQSSRVVADANNDGFSDILAYRDTGVFLALNNGHEFVGGEKPILDEINTNSCPRNLCPVYFIDVNNDALLDVVAFRKTNVRVALGTGTGFKPSTVWIEGFGREHYFAENLPRTFADMNGDGLPDIVGFRVDGIYVGINTGKDFLPEELWLNKLSHNQLWNVRNMDRRLFDINKDGITDFVGFRYEKIEVYLGKGRPIVGASPLVYPRGNLPINWNPLTQPLHIQDLDSDGQMAFNLMLNFGLWSSNIKADPFRLSKVVNGLGATTKISYGLLSDPKLYKSATEASFPLMKVSGALPVVRELQKSDGLGGFRSTSYTYENARMHRLGLGFLGFERRISVDHAEQRKTVETYSMATNQLQHGALVGVQIYTLGNTERLVSESHMTPASIPLGQSPLHVLVYGAKNVTKTYDEAGQVISSTTVHQEVDKHGNIVKQLTDTSDQHSTTTAVLTHRFADDEENWNLGLLAEATLRTSSSASGNIITKQSSFSYDSQGLLTSETTEANSPYAITKSYSRLQNAYGHVDTTTTTWAQELSGGLEFKAQSTKVLYDERGFVSGNVNALGHEILEEVDPLFGYVTRESDANKLKSSYFYDEAQRIAAVQYPDGTELRVTRERCSSQCPPLAVAVETVSRSGSGYKKTYSDVLGRKLRTVESGLRGQDTAQDFRYNASGQVVASSKPYFIAEGEPRYWHSYEYDERQRLVKALNPDGTSQSWSYPGLDVIHLDELGRKTQQYRNSSGKVLKVTNAIAQSISYTYDPAGRLVTIVDPANNQSHFSYDLYDNPTSIQDPNAGLTIKRYNALGQVYEVEQGSALVKSTFDELGRPILKIEQDRGGNAKAFSFGYDQGSHAVGMLTTVKGEDVEYDYRYDSYARLSDSFKKIYGHDYQSQQSYDAFGRVQSYTYPSGLSIDYAYDESGHRTEIVDAKSKKALWKLEELFPGGQTKSYSLGNGARFKQEIDEKNDRVLGEAVYSGAQNIYSRRYEYDAVGNMKSREDRQSGVTERFSYDALDRLKSFTTANKQDVNISYDELSRIASRSDRGAISYGSDCNGVKGGPHTLAAVGEKRYCHDSRGNVIKAGTMDISYNALNLPTLMTKGKSQVSFEYGAFNERIVRRDSTKGAEESQTFYFDDGYEETISPSTTLKRHLVGPSVMIILENGREEALYLHKDFLGSNLASSDSQGTIRERQDFDPFGQAREPASLKELPSYPTMRTKRGFTGHEPIDSMGLVHMNGRIYDPEIGLFLTPDPYVQNAGLVQNLNRYSYVLNNPLKYTDPSGLSFLDSVNRELGRAAESFGNMVRDPVGWVENSGQKFGRWVSNPNNQRLVASVAFAAAATIAAPYAGVSVWYQGMAYYAAVGYTTSYIASGGEQKAALNGAIAGAAFCFVGHSPLFEGASNYTRIAAHGVIGGLSSTANGGSFESGFLSAGLSQAASSYGLYESLGATNNPSQWQDYAYNAMASAIVGGTVSEAGGGTFENGAITAAYGRMFNDLAFAAQVSPVAAAMASLDGPLPIGDLAGGILTVGALCISPEALDVLRKNLSELQIADWLQVRSHSTIYVTPNGVALPPGRMIPHELVENPHRPGSYGTIDQGKFQEKLRIDAQTPPSKKGPNYSHYHNNGKGKHFSPRPLDKDPGFAK